MRVTKLQWDDDNIEHIARHGVSPSEALQACRVQPKFRRGRDARYLVLGRTVAGRHLLVVITAPIRGVARVITARAMDSRERAIYQRK